MISLSNPHTHTTYCDGKATIPELVARARSLGFVSLGFSGHGFQTFDAPYFMSETATQAYLRELRALQKTSRDLRVWVGVEQDYFSELCRADYDYTIGSAHYLRAGERFFSVDSDKASVDAGVRDLFAGDGFQMAKAYYDQLARMVESIRPDIVGHYDILRKNNRGNDYFDESGKAYRFLALDTLEAIAPYKPIIEVNTGGVARGYLTEFYPTEELLRRVKALDLEVIVASDCHRVNLLDTGMADAEAELRRLGFDHVTRLSASEGAVFEQVAL